MYSEILNIKEKTLEYYLNLDYKITTIKIDNSLGGGYHSFISQFGMHTICGCGNTKEESFDSCLKCKEIIFELFLENKIEIPLPL